MVSGGRGGGWTPADLAHSNALSALPRQALTSDWWRGQMGRDRQCNGSPQRCKDGAGDREGSPVCRRWAYPTEEGDLVWPDPFSSTRDAQRVGSVDTEAQAGHPAPPPGWLKWLRRPRPSNVSAACAGTVISGGLGWAGSGGGRARPRGEGSSLVKSPLRALPPPAGIPGSCFCALVPNPGSGLASPGLRIESRSSRIAPGGPSVKVTPGEFIMLKAWGHRGHLGLWP